jgi:imidazoleglycerol phosphate dehydratase HisB
MTESRTAILERQTSESKVRVSLDLDGSGRAQISTGVGFFDHMLTARRQERNSAIRKCPGAAGRGAGAGSG